MNIPLPILFRLAASAPDALAAIARETLRSRYTSRLDCHLGRGRAFLPRTVDIKLTHRCNLRCVMCGQWGTHGTARDLPPDQRDEVLPLPTLQRVVDEAATWGALFYLWGGEPFLYPHLEALLAHLRRRRLLCGINTNGTYLERDADFVVRHQVATLFVSLDGPREVHDAIRGGPGTFDRLVAGVRRIQVLKRRAGRAKPFITVIATVSPANCRNLEAIYHVAADLRVDFVGLQFSTFIEERRGHAYEALMRRHFGAEARSWRGFAGRPDGIDAAAVQRAVAAIRASRHPFATFFVPNLSLPEIPIYYADPSHTFGKRACVVPWMRADILPNGDVSTCIDFPDYVVGNVKEQGLRAIWNGARFRRFRQLVRGGLLPICSRCCGLYQYGH